MARNAYAVQFELHVQASDSQRGLVFEIDIHLIVLVKDCQDEMLK